MKTANRRSRGAAAPRSEAEPIRLLHSSWPKDVAEGSGLRMEI
jgi:hypothetical protein